MCTPPPLDRSRRLRVQRPTAISSSIEKEDKRTERKLLPFVYASTDADDNEEERFINSKIVGFARVYEDFETNTSSSRSRLRFSLIS